MVEVTILARSSRPFESEAGSIPLLETLHGERLSNHYDELIQHNRCAGNTPKALHYLRLATERGYALGAYERVLEYEKSALGLVKTQTPDAERTEQEIFWLHLLGWTLAPMRGFQDEEAAAAFRRLEVAPVV
jgi:hypothetical protein